MPEIRPPIKGLLTVPLFGRKASQVAPLPPDEVMLERLKEAPRCLSLLKGGSLMDKNGSGQEVSNI